MENLIARRQQVEIERLLASESAVLLIGQRQVGKTTLAGEIAKARDGVVLNFRDWEVARGVREQGLKQCIKDHGKHLTVLDEVQVQPGLFAELLPIIDERRAAGTDTGSFLLLGSASVTLANKSDESLHGRIHYVHLDPLDISEIDSSEMDKLWLRGGLPRSFSASSDAQSSERLRAIIDSLIMRELREHDVREAPDKIEDILVQLAYQHGGMINQSGIIKAVTTVKKNSVEKLIDVLNGLLVIRQLPAYSKARVKYHQKTPKVYYRDSGLLHRLLNFYSLEQVKDSHIDGLSWEGFVIENILRQAGRTVQGTYFSADKKRCEMDLVLKFSGGELWAIEIKLDSTGVSKGFYKALKYLKPNRSFIVHGRLDLPRHPHSPDVEIISLPDMCREVVAKVRETNGSNAGSAPPGSKPE